MRPLLEICVEDAAGLEAAIAGGADRIELCAALTLGGLTPPESLVRLAADMPVPVRLLARPREGDFRYGPQEAALVAEDIRLAAEAGLDGVVIGASTADYRLDETLLAAWVIYARALGDARGRPLGLTLHRAIDLCPDLSDGLGVAMALGFDHVLTSGGKPRAVDAVETLATLQREAGDSITVMAGSGIDSTTLPAILATGVRAVHASCRRPVPMSAERERAFGFQADTRRATDAATVRALREMIRG